MLKITVILSLMFIVSSVWSSCESCGSECARACGTRRFRACCFNYLRKKRTKDFKINQPFLLDVKASQPKSEVPVFLDNNPPMPPLWTTSVFSSENHPYTFEDMLENRSQ